MKNKIIITFSLDSKPEQLETKTFEVSPFEWATLITRFEDKMNMILKTVPFFYFANFEEGEGNISSRVHCIRVQNDKTISKYLFDKTTFKNVIKFLIEEISNKNKSYNEGARLYLDASIYWPLQKENIDEFEKIKNVKKDVFAPGYIARMYIICALISQNINKTMFAETFLFDSWINENLPKTNGLMKIFYSHWLFICDQMKGTDLEKAKFLEEDYLRAYELTGVLKKKIEPKTWNNISDAAKENFFLLHKSVFNTFLQFLNTTQKILPLMQAGITAEEYYNRLIEGLKFRALFKQLNQQFFFRAFNSDYFTSLYLYYDSYFEKKFDQDDDDMEQYTFASNQSDLRKLKFMATVRNLLELSKGLVFDPAIIKRLHWQEGSILSNFKRTLVIIASMAPDEVAPSFKKELKELILNHNESDHFKQIRLIFQDIPYFQEAESIKNYLEPLKQKITAIETEYLCLYVAHNASCVELKTILSTLDFLLTMVSANEENKFKEYLQFFDLKEKIKNNQNNLEKSVPAAAEMRKDVFKKLSDLSEKICKFCCERWHSTAKLSEEDTQKLNFVLEIRGWFNIRSHSLKSSFMSSVQAELNQFTTIESAFSKTLSALQRNEVSPPEYLRLGHTLVINSISKPLAACHENVKQGKELSTAELLRIANLKTLYVELGLLPKSCNRYLISFINIMLSINDLKSLGQLIRSMLEKKAKSIKAATSILLPTILYNLTMKGSSSEVAGHFLRFHLLYNLTMEEVKNIEDSARSFSGLVDPSILQELKKTLGESLEVFDKKPLLAENLILNHAKKIILKVFYSFPELKTNFFIEASLNQLIENPRKNHLGLSAFVKDLTEQVKGYQVPHDKTKEKTNVIARLINLQQLILVKLIEESMLGTQDLIPIDNSMDPSFFYFIKDIIKTHYRTQQGPLKDLEYIGMNMTRIILDEALDIFKIKRLPEEDWPVLQEIKDKLKPILYGKAEVMKRPLKIQQEILSALYFYNYFVKELAIEHSKILLNKQSVHANQGTFSDPNKAVHEVYAQLMSYMLEVDDCGVNTTNDRIIDFVRANKDAYKIMFNISDAYYKNGKKILGSYSDRSYRKKHPLKGTEYFFDNEEIRILALSLTVSQMLIAPRDEDLLYSLLLHSKKTSKVYQEGAFI